MKNRIIINKLIIEGSKYRRILPFNNGLNVINGDKTSGKSLVLLLIDYCLGKSGRINLQVQRELGDHIDQVFLELKIGSEIFTIKRNLKSNYNKFFVYFNSFAKSINYTPKVLERKDFLDFILIQLDIPKFQLTKNKTRSLEKTLESISFRDIMRFAYINQHDLGTDNFLDYRNYNIRYKLSVIFEVLTKLIEPDMNDLQNQKMAMENEIGKYESEIKGLKTYLKDKELSDLVEVDLKLEQLKSKIIDYKDQKKRVLASISNHKSENEEIYARLKRQILHTDSKIVSFKENIKDMNISILSKTTLLENYSKDRLELEATKESMYKMKICEHSLVCPICQSEVDSLRNNHMSVELIDKGLKQIDSRIRLVSEIISAEKENILINSKKVDEFFVYKSILERALNEFEENIEVPYISEIEALNRLIAEFSSQFNIILEAKRIHNKIEEIELMIEKLKKRLEKIGEELSKLESSKDYKQRLFIAINKDYKMYMERFKIDSFVNETYISKEDYFPYYNGAILFSHTSGGLLECIQIAYVLCLVNRKINDVTLNHPGFLLLDTIGKYLGTIRIDDEIKDPQVYEEIYRALIEASKSVQILVVDNTPPDIAKQYIKYTFYSDGRGFVDLNENHLPKEEMIPEI